MTGISDDESAFFFELPPATTTHTPTTQITMQIKQQQTAPAMMPMNTGNAKPAIIAPFDDDVVSTATTTTG